MWCNRFLVPTVLGCAVLFLAASSAHAQRIYGIYYPDEQKFVTYDEKPNIQFNITPQRFAEFTHQYVPRQYVPGSRVSSSSFYYAPAPAEALVRIQVPDANAKVWFDGAATKSTGMDRLYQSPVLELGSTYTYRIRATWMKDGKEVSQDRLIQVAPGQTTLVDFARAAAEPLAAPPATRKP
jgi:uncharacterized protein (TIGR03000 family)